MPHRPHPFARFTAILGRGRNLSRALTVEAWRGLIGAAPDRASAQNMAEDLWRGRDRAHLAEAV